MQQRGGERRQRDEAEQQEGGAGRQEAVELIGGPHRGVGDRSAGRRQDARNIGRRHASPSGNFFLSAQPFSAGDQAGRQECAEQDSDAGTDEARLDREFHQEEAAERERKSADPHHAARAEELLETGPVSGRRRRWLRWRSGRRNRRIRRNCAAVDVRVRSRDCLRRFAAVAELRRNFRDLLLNLRARLCRYGRGARQRRGG